MPTAAECMVAAREEAKLKDKPAPPKSSTRSANATTRRSNPPIVEHEPGWHDTCLHHTLVTLLPCCRP